MYLIDLTMIESRVDLQNPKFQNYLQQKLQGDCLLLLLDNFWKDS